MSRCRNTRAMPDWLYKASQRVINLDVVDLPEWPIGVPQPPKPTIYALTHNGRQIYQRTGDIGILIPVSFISTQPGPAKSKGTRHGKGIGDAMPKPYLM